VKGDHGLIPYPSARPLAAQDRRAESAHLPDLKELLV